MREIDSVCAEKSDTFAASERLYVAVQRMSFAENVHDCAWICEPIYCETTAPKETTPPNRVT